MGENKHRKAQSASQDHSDPTPEGEEQKAPSKKGGLKPKLMLALKLAFVVGAYGLIFKKILARDGAEDLGARIADLHWGWVVAAISMQLVAIGFATLRWRTLLGGQGIRPSWGFLGGSIMIARFFGAFTPGGFTGFGGWRIFDVAQHTKKVARATATIAVETLLGQVAFGLVVMGASVYGVRFIGTDGVLMVNGLFLGIVSIALTLLAKPALFKLVARFLPAAIQTRVQTLVDAVCAYKGKGKLLVVAVVCGVGVHAFNNLIYVCAARALGVELGVGEVFFASSLQIFATLIPASINGMGLRETAAVALYTSPLIGLPLAVAVLIPIVGFTCEMLVSSVGGFIFLARRNGYTPEIAVDDVDREDEAHAAIETVPLEEQPVPVRGLTIGLGAGLLAGIIVGMSEGAVIVASGNGAAGFGVLAYGAVAYGIFCGMGGAFGGLALAYSGRLMKRAAMKESDAYARLTAAAVAVLALGLGAFRVRRDIFQETLKWKSVDGLLVLGACLLTAGGLYLLISAALRWIVARKPGQLMLRAWGSPVVAIATCGLLALLTFFSNGEHANADEATAAPERAAPESAGNVLFIVVDTLRADHLPSYGYENGSTPNLDAFANDAVRFDMAFANASWTRPSFASILTGRLPSNHGVMHKPDALPDEIVTMPEALRNGGYHTSGIVTNYNVGPYFNFHQGFDRYQYLEPEFVLGADDNAAKLLLVQFLRQKIEKYRASRGQVDPDSAYRDVQVVNRELLHWVDEFEGEHADSQVQQPFFAFVGYMDPHDPYYEHPYSGSGYSRAANQHPDPEEAPRLRELYDGEITYWDEHFGTLIEDLQERGLYDDLTIIITADHGEEFCEHGGFWHGTTLYDEQVRVPLFVKLPANRRGGTVVRHWVQSIDLMPTLLEQVGLEVPEGVQGGDLFAGTDVVYAEESHEGNVLESVRQREGTDERKIIVANPGNPRGLGAVEMYRVDFDPGETENVAESDTEGVSRLLSTVEEQRRLAAEGAVEATSVEMDSATLERLCSLGYIERESCCEQGVDAYCD